MEASESTALSELAALVVCARQTRREGLQKAERKLRVRRVGEVGIDTSRKDRENEMGKRRERQVNAFQSLPRDRQASPLEGSGPEDQRTRAGRENWEHISVTAAASHRSGGPWDLFVRADAFQSHRCSGAHRHRPAEWHLSVFFDFALRARAREGPGFICLYSCLSMPAFPTS